MIIQEVKLLRKYSYYVEKEVKKNKRKIRAVSYNLG